MGLNRMAIRAAALCVAVAACGGACAADGLASSRIEHPAALHLVSDRRLKRSPEETQELVRQAMALDEAQITALILPRHGFAAPLDCPACSCQKLDFSLAEPNRLTCPECRGTLTSDTLPINQELTGKNPLGETVTYRCAILRRNPVCVAGRIRFRRHHTLARAARALGETYQSTESAGLAGRAVKILLRFAEVYPHWPVVGTQRPRSYLVRYTIGPARPYSDWEYAKWNRLFMYEIPQDLVFAYDLTYDCEVWDTESTTLGTDARRRVEAQLFRPALELALTVHSDMAGKLSNLNPTLYQRMIHLGRVLNDPGVIHQAVHFMQGMIRMSYHFDGMEYEGAVTYHGVVTGRLGIAARALSGYRDPDGYVDRRFGFSIGRGERPLDFPIHQKAWRVWAMMKFPNGNPVCIHDTNWGAGRAETPAEVEPANIELNAYGHFALGGGRGATGMQAHLHFCPRLRGPHYHQDRLGLILWGGGEELLPDIGYVHVGKPRRYFVNRAVAHNTVEVFFATQPEEPHSEPPAALPRDPVKRFKAIAMHERPRIDARSRLLAYDPGTLSRGQVELVAAASPGPDWMGVTRRERHLLMVRIDDSRRYLVDVLRVAGGNRHRFTLRGSADEDVATACALPLAPVPGSLAGPDVPYGASTRGVEPYSWCVHDMKRGAAGEPWSFTWQGQDGQASLRVFVAGQTDSTVILAKSPTLRRARQDRRHADRFQAPHLLIERSRVTDGLESVFATVYDCWPDGSAPAVHDVRWERLDEGAAAPLAVRVQLDGGREDLVYCSLDRAERHVGDVRCSGAWAVLSTANGRPQWAWARDGAVGAPDIQAVAPRAQELELVEVRRRADGAVADAFVVRGTVADPARLAGQWVRAVLGPHTAYGYEVAGVRAAGDGQTLIELGGEPGFTVRDGRWELLFNPFYEGDGPCRVRIVYGAFRGAIPPP